MRASTAKAGGIALVSVLLVVAIASALAYGMVDRQGFSIAHSRQTLAGGQARQLALGGEQYARQVLYADWDEEETREIDTLLEEWAAPTEAFEVDDGSIDIRIQDLDRRFNLNAVVGGADGAQNAARLKRLLNALEIDANLADRWVDWADADADVTGFGIEDAESMLEDPPRRTANQPAVHVSEFAVATGLDREAFERLRPHVAALPVDALSINVNTANEVVLSALAPNFDAGSAMALVARERKIARIEDITATHAALGEAVGVLAVRSAFFRIQVRAEVDGARSELTSLVHRDADDGRMRLLRRSFGDRFEALAWHEAHRWRRVQPDEGVSNQARGSPRP